MLQGVMRPVAIAPAPAGLASKKLLFVINEAYFLVSHRLTVARMARDAGFDVHVAAPSHHTWAPESFTLEELTKEGFTVHTVPLSRRGTNPLVEAATFASLCLLYRRLRPDIVHHITIKPNLYGGLAARVTRVPAVVYAVSGLGQLFSGRGFPWNVLRPPIARLLAAAFAHANARVIVQTGADGERLINERMVEASRVSIIRGSGVNLRRFHPAPEPPGKPVVLLAARLLWDKGIPEFIEASRRLRARGVEARFVLVGATHPSNPRAIPAATLEAWQREGIVEWWGYREDMAQVFAESHIFCLPTTYGEGVPKVLLEAAAAGRPVVASNIPGCHEAVRNGHSGLIVAMGDAEALADALTRLVQDPGLRLAMGVAGRQMAEAEFDEALAAARTLAVYRALIAPGE